MDEEAPEFAPWFTRNAGEPNLVAPFESSIDAAAKFVFHRDAKPGSWEANADYSAWLTDFADVLSDYDLHPEAKFHGGTGTKSGELVRRRVYAQRIRLVGKESHEWEENEALGLKADPEVQFGEALPNITSMVSAILTALDEKQITSNELSRRAKVSRSSVSAVKSGQPVAMVSIAKMFRVLQR